MDGTELGRLLGVSDGVVVGRGVIPGAGATEGNLEGCAEARAEGDSDDAEVGVADAPVGD